MKRLLFVPLLLLGACAQPADTADDPQHEDENVDHVAEMGTVVGEDPGDGAVMFADDLAAAPDAFLDAPIRVAGVVSEVCQNAGCWLTFLNDDGVPIRVNVPRDENGYVFTFPKDISGSHVLVAGTLAVEETPVETLQHFAEDRGDSEEAIAAITEPERTLVLTATGARIEGEV